MGMGVCFCVRGRLMGLEFIDRFGFNWEVEYVWY